MIARRTFVTGSLSTLALAGLAPTLLAGRRERRAPSLAWARERLHQSFRLRGAQSCRVELVRVDEHACDGRLEQYSMVFRAPCGTSLEEGRYELRAGDGERTELFLQTGPSEGAGDYVRCHVSRFRGRS